MIYPAELPQPQRSGYGFEPVNQLKRTELQSGRARQRVAFTSVPTFVELRWICDQVQAQYFEAWATQVARGDWFTVKLRTPLGLQDTDVRFAESPKGPDLFALNHWAYTARVEVRNRQVVAPGWALYLPLYIAHSSIFDQAMNREWPQ